MTITMVVKATSIANTLQGGLVHFTAWFVPSVWVFITVHVQLRGCLVTLSQLDNDYISIMYYMYYVLKIASVYCNARVF